MASSTGRFQCIFLLRDSENNLLNFSAFYFIRQVTLLNQSMRRQYCQRHRQTQSVDIGVEVTECVAVFIPFNGEFSTFCSLGQTWRHQLSWFSQQASHLTTSSSYIAWLLAGVLWNVDFPHCIAMHALLVKVGIEVNSFLFHVKSKHTVSSYCVRVSYQVPWG